MMKLFKKFRTFILTQDGQGMVEYGLIIALVAIVVIGAIMLLGGNVSDIFQKAADSVSASPT